MNQAELEQIVDLVTRQVLNTLAAAPQPAAPEAEGLPKVLLVGKEKDELPEALCRDWVVLDIEDYRAHKNVLRYDRILIGRLNITQLADLAQGRIGDEVTCAVLHGLLSGVDTRILEDAFGWRKYAGKGSTALYQMLEGYVRTLQGFGVKPLTMPRACPEPPPAPPRFSAPPPAAVRGTARPNARLLVTETQAMELLAQGGPVQLPAGFILTPSARDVFARAGVWPTAGETRQGGNAL